MSARKRNPRRKFVRARDRVCRPPRPWSKEENQKLQELLIDGLTVEAIAKELDRSYASVFLHMNRGKFSRPNMRGRSLSPQQHQEIIRLLMKGELSQAQIAGKVGCSQHAVHTRNRLIIGSMRRRVVESAGDFQPIELKEPRVCPVHGPVTIWPCVACAARKG